MWQDRAACKDDPAPECWMPTSATDDAARAIRVCFGCKVRSECLAYHMDIEREVGLSYGIAGGLRATERRQLLKIGAS